MFRLWVIIFTHKKAPRQTFTCSESIIEALKKYEICLKLKKDTAAVTDRYTKILLKQQLKRRGCDTK